VQGNSVSAIDRRAKPVAADEITDKSVLVGNDRCADRGCL
jgi:hypothetical protein